LEENVFCVKTGVTLLR